MTDDAPAPTPTPTPAPAPAPDDRRSPRDYRPDVRPMLILVSLLFAVVVAWLFLSPLILPAS